MSSAELYSKGARVWIPDPEKVWRAAELLEDYKGQTSLKIQYEEAEDLWVEGTINVTDKTLPHLRNPEILIGENDLTSLSYLNEPEVLYNLKVRFVEQNLIYTYCGIVLVAINPYEYLDIYSNDIIQAYSGQDMGAMDPHIFAVSEEAFKQMSRFDRNQSIIVSGESGAGKTVSAKFAMRYFATVGGSQAETQVERKVLASNPIMEAIGNAKTTRNDNSSRFGKYIEISFSKQHSIVGAHMRTYLLEKSRVVFQASEERNYHIFYQLCASDDLPEFKDFHLGSPEDFFYTSQGAAPQIRDVDDAEELVKTRKAFTTLGFPEKDQMMIFRILSAVLHFGNVTIKEKEGESCEIPAKDPSITIMCKLLGIEESQMRMWLCHRKIQTVNETLTKPLTESQASFARDALVKYIYSSLFDWIVTQINKALQSNTKTFKFIGVLDIYGFETFAVNSFEQFCINYANEKLQQIFNMHVFKLEQEEYVREKIEWSFIDFYDNQPCIDLIESKLGILDLLDEECKMPKGSDANWCQKLYDKHLNKSQHFDKPRMSRSAFIINHFADRVEYQADGFLEKNRDTVLEEQINTLKASEYELVAELFTEESSSSAQAGAKRGRSSSTTQPIKAQPKAGSKQHKKTVGSQFRDSLCALMETLNATTPHYIRCIKPNDLKEAFAFDPKRAVEQLRACGVLETIRISAAGYPSRWTYPEFFQRYRVLALSKHIFKNDMRKTCEAILPALISDNDKYRFGKTKIFFRAGQVAYLEKLRADKLRACGVMIQKHIRGWLQRRKYQRVRKSVLLVQTFGRGLLARRHADFLRKTRAATRIQARWRGYRQRQKFNSIHSAVVVLQAHVRAMFARKRYMELLRRHKVLILQKNIRAFTQRMKFKRVMRGIVLVQSHFRRRKAKLQLKILKVEAKSVDHIKQVNKGLENKIIELQQRLDEKAKIAHQAQMYEVEIVKMKEAMNKLKSTEEEAKLSSNKVVDLADELERLRAELEKVKGEKQDLIMEKDMLVTQHDQVITAMVEEKMILKEELDKAQSTIKRHDEELDEYVREKVAAANKLLIQEFESERAHHQKLVKEHARLQQRLENLHSEMQVLTSPTKGHHRSPSDISAISIESYSSSAADSERKAEEDEDQGYDTTARKHEVKKLGNLRAPEPPSGDIGDKEEKKAPAEAVDIGLVLKLQNKVKDLEREKKQLMEKIESMEEDTSRGTIITDSAFDALKQELVSSEEVGIVIKLQKRVRELEAVKKKLTRELDQREDDKSDRPATWTEDAFESLKMQDLQNDNDKLKREVSKLMKSIAESVPMENTKKSNSKAGQEFFGSTKMADEVSTFKAQFEAMADELERRREECLQLKAMLADRTITTHSIARESYGGNDVLVNEDNELEMAYKTQKDLNRLLQSQLEKTEKDIKKKEKQYAADIGELKKENDRQQKIISQLRRKNHSLNLGPEAKIEATMQHEITRLTSENLDLRESMDKQSDQIRKLKKMLKVYAKKLKDGEGWPDKWNWVRPSMSVSSDLAAEIAAEIENEENTTSTDAIATVIHRERSYMGMLEFKKEDEGALIKNLIQDLKPKLASGLIPGLPAYILFMCVRHTDYVNDDEKVKSLLTATINGIKKVVKRHSDDLERITLWLANTCRLLHTLKQYSGEKQFQNENTPKQNEQSLRNFDLSEYRQVFSDLAVWNYQALMKLMEELIQPNIVPAILEHEAIAGLTASKPSGLRGRSSSNARELEDGKDSQHALDALMRTLNSYMRIVKQHAVDPELVKQIFRQLFYFLCAGALNNLLLRKDMCNWSKGMQIRYNLSHLEQWLRDNNLHEFGAQAALEPIIQASQLLQARKTDSDVDSVCDMCSKLTTAQIVKILNIYTPVDEFEERVPVAFIRKIQSKLKEREEQGTASNTLLLDTKYSYPVTFPFNPSSVALETITVPEQLHLGFLIKH
ncbi:unconventional myosin-Va-like isoform X4 [Biomphalaria glabrata]|uniref:Unconventional myosin-Va-like isoform X4 n=1 Tax=Biomphalaria glabrata TaxID=6526 RepID=A0A9W2ZD35_BIOGL|nr:unconventional myosin-Va-like isoform X4 [Biomphalaria glabrata]